MQLFPQVQVYSRRKWTERLVLLLPVLEAKCNDARSDPCAQLIPIRAIHPLRLQGNKHHLLWAVPRPLWLPNKVIRVASPLRQQAFSPVCFLAVSSWISSSESWLLIPGPTFGWFLACSGSTFGFWFQFGSWHVLALALTSDSSSVVLHILTPGSLENQLLDFACLSGDCPWLPMH